MIRETDKKIYGYISILSFLASLAFLLFLLTGCEKEVDIFLKESGSVTFLGNAGGLANKSGFSSSKEVPECSEKAPTMINFVLTDVNGFNWVESSSIQVSGSQITQLDEVSFPIGSYTVNDISITSDDGTVVFRVPNSENQIFDFTGFVDLHTPFNIQILPAQNTDVNGEVLCYTADQVDITGGVSGLSIKDLQTMYFNLPDGHCIERVTAEVDGVEIFDVAVSGTGVRSVPIPKDFGWMWFSTWDSSGVIQRVGMGDYNIDEILTANDIINFSIICNG